MSEAPKDDQATPEPEDQSAATPGHNSVAAKKLAVGAVVAGITASVGGAAYEASQSNDSGVPVGNPEAKISFEVPEGTPTFRNTGTNKDGNTIYMLNKPETRTIDVHETKAGGLVATDEADNPVHTTLNLPMAGPGEHNVAFRPDDSDPAIEYTPPVRLVGANSDEHLDMVGDAGGVPYINDRQGGDSVLIQEDGHGGLVARTEEGEPITATIPLPAPTVVPQLGDSPSRPPETPSQEQQK